jgi:hypothetical protein
MFRAGCRYFTDAEAREHWGGAKQRGDWANYKPGHGARMLAAIDALIELAKGQEWPDKLEQQPEAVAEVSHAAN